MAKRYLITPPNRNAREIFLCLLRHCNLQTKHKVSFWKHRGSQGTGPGDGGMSWLPQPSPARPATENPHGKRQSHILSVVHNSEQTVHRTTGLWLLVQCPPPGSHVGHTGGRFLPGIWENVSDKILPVDPTVPLKEVSLWHGALQQAEVRPQSSSALPLFPQCPTAVCASVSLSTRVQLTSSTTGFYLQLPNMFQLE